MGAAITKQSDTRLGSNLSQANLPVAIAVSLAIAAAVLLASGMGTQAPGSDHPFHAAAQLSLEEHVLRENAAGIVGSSERTEARFEHVLRENGE